MQRRKFIGLLAQGLVAPYIVTFDARAALGRSSQAPSTLRTDLTGVFDLSVASGDPSANGAVLWTHVRPDAYRSEIPLWVQVAADAAFNTLLLEARIPSGGPERDYTTSVALQAELEPGVRYFYRFIYGDIASRTGRFRTLPVGDTARLKFALLTCQDFTNGYYGALRHVAEDDSVDFVLHLGDFIYESVGDPRFQEQPFEDRRLALPSAAPVALGLNDYRYLFSAYRRDPELQRLLEQHTLIAVPDDHETANDCYWDYGHDTLGAPDHPFRDQPDRLTQLKLEAQRAWLEYMPARVESNPDARHPHDYSRVYRGFEFGDLVRLSMLDTRTYRTPHPCGEGELFQRFLPLGCSSRHAETQSLLGAAQRAWLMDRLSSSHALWNLVGNQTLLSRLSLGFAGTIPLSVDAWDGYEAERRWLAGEIHQRAIQNFVVVTGDMHTYVAAQVLRNYDNRNPFDTRNVVGTEFMTPSITSANLIDVLRKALGPNHATLSGALTEGAVRLANPHLKYFNASTYGYSTLELNREYCEWAAYAVDKNSEPGVSPRRLLTRIRKYTWWPWLVEA